MEVTHDQSTQPDRSARRLLVEWANAQDGWIRQATAAILASGSALDEESLGRLYQQYLAEKGLTAEAAQEVPEITLEASDQENSSVLRLVKLSDVSGVNALAEDQTIEFNEHLTVVFGENGTGKTGYTRVLKRVAKARTSEAVLGNLRTPSDATPTANLAFAIDGQESSLTWSGEDGLPPLDRIDVFDSPSVMLHLDTDLTYAYTPADLALFKYVADAIRAVSDRVANDLQSNAQRSPAFLQLFERGTEVYPLVESLSAATDLDRIRELAAVSDDDVASVPNLKQNISALEADNIGAQIAVARNREQANAELLTLTDAVQRFDTNAYEQARTDLAAALKEQADLTALISRKHEIPGADDESWRSFVVAGERYRQHLELHPYPVEGAACIYCRQPLGKAEVEVLSAYRDLVTNTAQTTINNATRMLGTLSSSLTSIDLAGLREHLEQEKPGEGTDQHTDEAVAFVDTLSPLQAALSRGERVDIGKAAGRAGALGAEATRRIEASRVLLQGLSTKSEERQQSLAAAKKRLASLQARIRLRQNLPEIEEYVESAKWLARLKVVQGRLPSTLASATNVTKEAGELLLNNNFDERFQEERRALRAPEVELDFPGRQGTTRRVKTVAAHRPSIVLSEGEQKVIALADFLAESGLRMASAPVIFDDPVNSLDYRRIEEVSTRIAELAKQRQVVVFTHNIWFATELLSRYERDQTKCSYFTIEDDGPIKGIVTRGSHPRWDTVSKLSGRINAALQAARAAEGEVRDALVESTYSLVRSWIEVVVEQDILKKVVQRYQPNIMLTQLPAIDGAKLDAAKASIYPIYEKACRVMEGHSQPLETLSLRPKLTDLEAEWAELQSTRTTYMAP